MYVTIQTETLEIAGKKLIIETGKVAKQANGACTVTMGDTVVLVTVVTAKEPREGVDFMPLTVDYRERTYSAGKIPGGFFKREVRPRENEILKSRLIDRSIRPFFPEAWRNDTNVAALVISYDGENDPAIPCIIGTSVALKLADVPFPVSVGAVRIGRINGSFVVNPTISELKTSELDLAVSGTSSALAMVEAGSQELPENVMLEALNLAQEEVRKICEFQQRFTGKTKLATPEIAIDPGITSAVEAMAKARTGEIVAIAEKGERENTWSTFKKEVVTKVAEQFPEQEKSIKYVLEDLFYRAARDLILNKKVRSDGRTYEDIRPITCETAVLPRTHGSALFTRGQTQSLATVTLGTPDDQQIMDELGGEYKERFMLHYNFPGFATGEAKPERGTSRREMGHGALARRALSPLLPTIEEFPYTLRVVSDILESNGSSSMASVCAGSMSLFDAGVPLKAAVAGVAMGLVMENGNYAILTDIMGMEDHLGDMDFKVAGTRKGITALQMDIKIAGLTTELMAKALDQANRARMTILGKMEAAIQTPRADISDFAPRMVTLQIPQSKIGELIGPGGKNIRRIQEDSGAEIDIEDDGKVFISSTQKTSVDLARQMVEYFTADVEVGKIYKGKVTRILNFGAFVEILPGKEGLCHISQLAEQHVRKVEDVVHEGDELTVKVVEIDNQGRVNLSRKAVILGEPGKSRS
jgi:polyribonucleotide nucleotidyltransferase